METLIDESEIAINFTGADGEFVKTLESTFPNEEIATRSSFSGAEIVTLLGAWTSKFVETLARFLTEKKKTESARTIRIKIGKNEMELQGFGGDDIASMKQSLNDLVQQLRKA